MNIFVVVEGEIGEKRVYKKWIPFVNPEMVWVESIFDISENNFTIIAGGGYPNYFEVIENAIDDVNSLDAVDRLVIAVDSEEMSFDEKWLEMYEFLADKTCSASISVIIQHFCMETWALGNKRVGPRNPRTKMLKTYKIFSMC